MRNTLQNGKNLDGNFEKDNFEKKNKPDIKQTNVTPWALN